MNQLSILSRDAEHYAAMIEEASLPHLVIREVHQQAISNGNASDCNILLADPNLGAISLAAYPKLTWLQSTWAGVKPLLDVERNDFLITGIKDVFGSQMREYVFAYMLYFSRQISSYENLKHKKVWQPMVCDSLVGKTIGIFGLGSIGNEVAKTAKHFEMKVLAVTRSSRNNSYVDQYISAEQIVDCANQMDFVVILLPDTPQSRGFINADFLNALPKHCVLINAGRSQVVDENALLDVLQKQRIRAAVLDVYLQEPLPSEHPFWQLENTIITQHTSAISKPEMIVEKFIENYLLFLKGEPLNSVVDQAIGY
ncbi:MAG: D-2-hydroxyacid dehydrogenase [Aliiglaciecola sp.]